MRSHVTFITDPVVKRYGVNRMVLIGPLLVNVNDLALSAPEGFVFDGASVPKLVQWLLFWLFLGYQHAPNVWRAAAIHDRMCQERHWVGSRRTHEIFYHILLADGVHRVRAWCFWKGVLWFGPTWESRDAN